MKKGKKIQREEIQGLKSLKRLRGNYSVRNLSYDQEGKKVLRRVENQFATWRKFLKTLRGKETRYD